MGILPDVTQNCDQSGGSNTNKQTVNYKDQQEIGAVICCTSDNNNSDEEVLVVPVTTSVDEVVVSCTSDNLQRVVVS